MPNKQSIITKSFSIIALVLVAFTMQFCNSSKTASTSVTNKQFANPVSYKLDIAPILDYKCTPCHYPEKGKKELLHTYAGVQDNIKGILKRVQLPENRRAFMPFKSKNEPLTTSEIQLLKNWVAQGMPE